jgi:hypothetical protein
VLLLVLVLPLELLLLPAAAVSLNCWRGWLEFKSILMLRASAVSVKGKQVACGVVSE